MHTGAGGGFVGLGTAHILGELIFDTVEALVWTYQELRESLCATEPFGAAAPDESPASLREALILHGYAPSTAAKYGRIVAAFLQRVAPAKMKWLRDDDIEDYLESLREREVSDATQRLHLCALRSVFDKLLGMGLTAGIKHAPRPVARPPATEEDVRRLLVACRNPEERFICHALNGLKLLPHQLCRLGATGRPALFCWRKDEKSCADSRFSGIVPIVVTREGSPHTGWMLPSSRRPGPISTRTMRRVMGRLAQSCGLRTTCTAVRMGPVVSFGRCA